LHLEKGRRETKTLTLMMVMGLVLVAMLVMAAVPAGCLLRSQIELDELRMTGVNIDLAQQDVTLATFAVQGWGNGTFVTGEGTWYTAWKAKTTDDGLASRATAYGRDGLEGQFFYWESTQLFPPFESPPCETETALMVTGFIRGH
jgi:hypothetical protein